MSRRPVLNGPLPGPKAASIIQASSRSVSPSYTRDYPLVAAKGEGVWITDPDGNEFLDMTAGIAVTSTGHCHPEVVAAIKDQADQLLHMSGTDFYYPAQAQLAEALASRVPVRGDDVRVYFGNSGAEAIEAAMKLARWKTGRMGFISFYGAFHGRTFGALSLTASKAIQKQRFAPLVPGVHHAYYPDPFWMGGPDAALARSFDSLQKLFHTVLPPDEVAAIVVEPIQGEGGYVIPPAAFLPELRQLCDDHGILLVFDEVQSGMGRTGKLWACEHTGVQPDILCSAKGIASGLPLGATFATAEVMSWPPGTHASTFGGNPLACAAALKTLELLENGLIENAKQVGDYLQHRLDAECGAHAMVGQVRGQGLMVAVDIIEPGPPKRRDQAMRNALVQACFERGLLILGCGKNAVRFSPGLCLTRDEADVAVELFSQAIAANI